MRLKRDALVISLLLIAIVAVVRFRTSITQKSSLPAGDPDEEYRVYCCVIQRMLHAHPGKVCVFNRTDADAVPKRAESSIRRRMERGRSRKQALHGLELQVGRYERAMMRLSPFQETRADFELQNEYSRKLENKFKFANDRYEVNLSRNPGIWQLSAVGFNHDHDQALVTIYPAVSRYDYLLARTSSGEWRVTREFGGRSVMESDDDRW